MTTNNKIVIPTVYSYVSLEDTELVDLKAQFTREDLSYRQKVGTLGLLNANYQMVAKGALDEWLSTKGNTAPMYVAHNDKTLPFGRWENFELVNGKDLYAVPRINSNMSSGSDLIAALENGDIRGISWGVRPRDMKSFEYRKRTIDGENYYVLTVTNGIVSEVSAVYRPADKSAFFRKKKKDPMNAAIQAVLMKRAAQCIAARNLVEGVRNG